MTNLRPRLLSIEFLIKNQNQAMQDRFGISKNLVSIVLLPVQLSLALTLLVLKTIGVALDKFEFIFASNKSMIQSVQGDLPKRGVRARVFVLYAKDCVFNPLDLDFIRSAFTQSEHFSVIINCDCQKYEIHQVQTFPASLLIVRKNLGYDFGAYRDAYVTLSPNKPQIITFINNSIVFKPEFNNWMEDFEAKFIISEMPIGGVTESCYPKQHIQSYLFSINLERVNSELEYWIKNIRNLNRKTAIVNYHEVGLSQFCREAGVHVFTLYSAEFLYSFAAKNWIEVLGPFAVSPVYKQVKLNVELGLSVNPTHGLWRFLAYLGCPIIKKDLIIKNPGKFPDLYGKPLNHYRKHL